MKLKTGILMLLVGIAIIGMTASSVSAGDALCKSIGIPSLNGYQCTIDTGSSCVCGNVVGADYWESVYGNNWCYNYVGYQWYTEW